MSSQASFSWSRNGNMGLSTISVQTEMLSESIFLNLTWPTLQSHSCPELYFVNWHEHGINAASQFSHVISSKYWKC